MSSTEDSTTDQCANDCAADAVVAMNKRNDAYKRKRLVRVLMVRLSGFSILAVAVYVLLIAFGYFGPVPNSVTYVAGMIDLVMFFMGFVMAFGKIDSTQTKKKGFDMSVSLGEDECSPSECEKAYNQGYNDGYEDRAAEEDEEPVAGSENGTTNQPQ